MNGMKCARVVLSLALTLALASCGDDTAEREDAAVDLAADRSVDGGGMLPSSMKGYELYSWKADGQTCFTLITGTNRNKDISEIGASDIEEGGFVRLTRCGLAAIEAELARIPSGEGVSLSDGRFVSAADGGTGPALEHPDETTIAALRAFCAAHGIVFSGPLQL